jgi:hypothetical protein
VRHQPPHEGHKVLRATDVACGRHISRTQESEDKRQDNRGRRWGYFIRKQQAGHGVASCGATATKWSPLCIQRLQASTIRQSSIAVG